MKIELEFPFDDCIGYKIFSKKEGRWFISYIKDKRQRSISYARYLMSVKEKRFLDKAEQVDHINDIKDDDRIENLQILSIKENNNKSRPMKCKVIICPTCEIPFLQARITRIYCSKSCARKSPKEISIRKSNGTSFIKGKKKYSSINELPHGTHNCYSYHKCRCSLCKEANRINRAKYKRR